MVRATCRALVFTGNESYEQREFPVPDPPAGGAVLRVEAVGMCGSDVAQWHGLVTLPGMRYPIVPGHEIVGVVDKLATDAELGVSEGDRVAVDEVVAGRARCASTATPPWTTETNPASTAVTASSFASSQVRCCTR